MRRFWIFNHYATTPLTGPLLRHFYFAEYLKEKGIETTVFAANELHQTGGCVDTHGKPYLRTEEEGVPFVFVKTSKYQGNGLSRVKNMISFFTGLMKISRKYAKEYGKPDVIMGSSAHPLTSIAGILIARRFHVPAIVEVRDLWPEAIFSVGKVKMNSLPGRMLSAGEKWMYVHADAIVFTKEGDVDHIKEMGWDTAHGGKIDLKKCHYVNNGVKLSDYYESIEKNVLDDPDLTSDTFKVVYTGTVRPVNNVGNLLDTAKLLKDKKDIQFLIFGGGSRAVYMELDSGLFLNTLYLQGHSKDMDGLWIVVDEETGLPIWIDCTFRSYGKALPAPVEAGKRFFDGIGVTAEYRDGVFVLEDSGGLIYSVHVDRTFGRLCISPVGFGNAVSGAEASN